MELRRSFEVSFKEGILKMLSKGCIGVNILFFFGVILNDEIFLNV